MDGRANRALLRLLKYEAKHEKFHPGRPPVVDPKETLHYSREIARALRKAGQKRLDEITMAGSPEGVAEVFARIPENVTVVLRRSFHRLRGWDEPVRQVLLGGWEWRGKTMTVLLPAENGNSPRMA